jgi:hypothetical protein
MKHPPGTIGLLQVWSQWDTGWYLLISRIGYFEPRAANFFPLYPALIGAIAFVLGDGQGPIWTGGDILRLVIALVVANAGALVGFVAIALLADETQSESLEGPRRALRVAAAYPFALFWAAAYTEGPFFGLAGLTLLFARRGAWRWAALTGCLAALTRPVGLALLPAMAWEYGRQHGWWTRQWRANVHIADLPGALLAVGAVPAGFAIYATFLWIRFGDPLLFLHTQLTYWHHQAWPIWSTLGEAFVRAAHGGAGAENLDLAAWLVVAVITVLAVRRLPFAFTLYTATLLYLAISTPLPTESNLILSTGRYLTAAIPAFLAVAMWVRGRPWLEFWVVSIGFLLQAVLTLDFLQGGPIH